MTGTEMLEQNIKSVAEHAKQLRAELNVTDLEAVTMAYDRKLAEHISVIARLPQTHDGRPVILRGLYYADDGNGLKRFTVSRLYMEDGRYFAVGLDGYTAGLHCPCDQLYAVNT